jgi:hypothetical protein
MKDKMMNSISVSVDGQKQDGKYDDWFLKQCVSTLTESEEIKGDKKLMKALQPLLNKKAKAITSLADVRSAAADAVEQDSKDKSNDMSMTKK